MFRVGRHALIDMWGCQEIDDEMLHAALDRCAEAIGCHKLLIHVHRFDFPGGATGFVLLSESHISVHTWPEFKYVSADIYSCGNSMLDPGVDVLTEVYAPSSFSVNIIDRSAIAADRFGL